MSSGFVFPINYRNSVITSKEILWLGYALTRTQLGTVYKNYQFAKA